MADDKPLRYHNLATVLCEAAFRDASLAVGTWLLARAFDLTLATRDAAAAVSESEIYITRANAGALTRWQFSELCVVPFACPHPVMTVL